MPDYLKITVTEDDVAKGQRFRSGHCPIALALNRQYPEALSWSVDPENAWSVWSGSRGCWRDVYTLSRRAQAFLRHFDWELELPDLPVTFRFKRGRER